MGMNGHPALTALQRRDGMKHAFRAGWEARLQSAAPAEEAWKADPAWSLVKSQEQHDAYVEAHGMATEEGKLEEAWANSKARETLLSKPAVQETDDEHR